MAFENYRHYFDIDPEYFPQVNDDIINKNPDLWKKFYPHETFVKLVKDTVSVLSRKQKVSIWVEGAYGTGKSHAVLTLKKLLDASEEDTKAYFTKYGSQLSNDLYNQFQGLKSTGKKILTVHRYGSSDIHNDGNLANAIQESIVHSLKEAGLDNAGQSSLKESALKWLAQDWAKSAFNSLIQTKYKDLFGGDDAHRVIEKLNTYTGKALSELMEKIMKVGDENQFKAFTLGTDDLAEWIKNIIAENDLKAIVFIWDEFTDFFRYNMRGLTGFQRMVDLSGSVPFYMIIVTHNISHVFGENDQDLKRIKGRFVDPMCYIELPENMAFRLMGAAMDKNKDSQVMEDWNDTVDDLYERTRESRKLVKSKARITDTELKGILPIHPYAALLLKHISSAFDSNQRSMFDFIKNDHGDEIKGFQWFIDNYGPEDDNPLLTVDMLWDFFYEKGKEQLSNDIRAILDCYPRAKGLAPDEGRVLKTVLLLQAISYNTRDQVDLFIPNEKNINNAFEGSDLDIGAAARIAEKLVRDEILFKKQMPGNKYQFSALINSSDQGAVAKNKEVLRNESTMKLVELGEVAEAVTLSGALKLRFKVLRTGVNEFKNTVNKLRSGISEDDNKIPAILAFAKNDAESIQIGKNIKSALENSADDIVFIDASINPLGQDLFNQYLEAMANSQYQRGKDNTLANQYELNAKEALKKWKSRIEKGEFYIYTQSNPQGERVVTIDQLNEYLLSVDRKRFPLSLESDASVIDNMWVANSLKLGVDCGATGKLSGTYKTATKSMKLENYLGEAWNTENYWTEKPYLKISKIKAALEEKISEAFKKDGRVSIKEVYNVLKAEPYGFMPCNLTAFVMGFLLREYTDEKYSWSDGLTNDNMSVLKLKEMVNEVISLQNTPNPRYKEKFIVTITEEERNFLNATSQIFAIPRTLCTSIEQTRDRVRKKIKEFAFPLWCFEYAIDTAGVKSSKNTIIEIIKAYGGLANNANYGTKSTDNDIAISIGKIFGTDQLLIEDLSVIFSKEKCIEGMDTYLKSYDNGSLIHLSKEIDDKGQYINELKKKFDADAANWVWNKETAQRKIDEVILEYRIIAESNKVIPKTSNFKSTIKEWCDKCQYIRISYSAAKNYYSNTLNPLMKMLYEIKRSSMLSDSKKQEFLDVLIQSREEFNAFYNNQLELFKDVCSFYLDQFTNDEIKDILLSLPVGSFIKDKSEYLNLVSTKVDKYRTQQGSAKLKSLWKEKTGTTSPKEWSNFYKMPILCMIPDDEVQAAQETFNVINKSSSSKNEVDKALHFVENAVFFEKLNDENARDEAFKKNIIKRYSVILTDVEEVKHYLYSKVSAVPYNWYGLPEIEKKIAQLAEARYAQSGCDKALEKIDNMELDAVKSYLKKLIKDNMNVGMEIIKDN